MNTISGIKEHIYRATWRRFAVCLVLVGIVSVSFPSRSDASLQDLNNQKNAVQNTLSQTQQQKQQQQVTLNQLNNDVANLTSQINATQASINAMSNQINDTNKHINDLNNQISQKQAQIDTEQANLKAALNQMYIDATSTSPALQFVQSNNMSDAVTNLQSYQAVELAISQKAQAIAAAKADLEQNKTDAEKQKTHLQSLQADQIGQKNNLTNQTALKNTLIGNSITTINQLNDAITQYQNQLKVIDGNINQLLASIQRRGKFTPASGDLAVVNDWSSNGFYYSQRSGSWAGTLLSPFYGYTMADSGCVITSLTMVANYYGIRLDPGQMLQKLQNGGAMYGPNLASSQVSSVLNGKLSLNRVYGADWGTANAYLAQGRPVIAHLGPEGHFVVISAKTSDGRYIVEDPYYTPSENSGYSSRDVDGFAFAN